MSIETQETIERALYTAFSEEFAQAYKTPNETLKQRVFNQSWVGWKTTGGRGGFTASTIMRALQILAESVERIAEPQWNRTSFTSIWHGPDIELIVVQNYGSDESWSWTARGFRQPGEDDGVDRWGWVNTTSREACEKAAMGFYLEKDA